MEEIPERRRLIGFSLLPRRPWGLPKASG